MIHTNIVAVNNFLRFINENWTSIVVFAGLFLAVLTKIRNYLNLSKEEKINEALKIIKKELLQLMSKAEITWSDYAKSGEIKKSEVISKIYSEFPILKEYINQDELIEIISKMIDDEMDNLNKAINGIETKDEEKEEEKKGE